MQLPPSPFIRELRSSRQEIRGSASSDVSSEIAIACCNPGSSVDTSFGAGNRLAKTSSGAPPPLPFNSLTARSSWQLPPSSFVLMSNLDIAFGAGGRASVDFKVSALAIQSDDKLVVAGTSSNDFALARFNANGSLDDGTPNDSTPGDSCVPSLRTSRQSPSCRPCQKPLSVPCYQRAGV
ncbi:MAG: delta-60 repeat domain-containing protein [Pyrinomonadaceae bacterium]